MNIMLPLIQNGLQRVLEGRRFNRCIDLGCGTGDGARILRFHVDYLMGVDNSEEHIHIAESTGLYDELILDDVRHYWPSGDLVVLMEVIEHLSHEEGDALLRRISYIPNLILSTPREFFPNPPSMPHLSIWTEEELWQYGFETQLLFAWFQPTIILGTKFA